MNKSVSDHVFFSVQQELVLYVHNGVARLTYLWVSTLP